MTPEPRKPKVPPPPTTEGGDHSVPEQAPSAPAEPSGMASEGDSDPRRPGGMGSEG